MKMLLNLLSVLVDGAGYGGDGPKGGFPQGVLVSFAWEGWWQDEPDDGSTP